MQQQNQINDSLDKIFSLKTVSKSTDFGYYIASTHSILIQVPFQAENSIDSSFLQWIGGI